MFGYLTYSKAWLKIKGIFAERRADGGFRKVASEFLTEVGVLVFVFPVVDTLVQFGREKVTALLALGSLAGSVACFLLAVILKEPED
jgi:hypothetical protein